MGLEELERDERQPELHHAVALDDLREVKRLIAEHENVNQLDDDGRTALHFAVSCEVVDALARAGADLESRDYSGWAPLHQAARRGRSGAVEALLNFGVAVDARDAKGRTPLHKAALRGYEEIVKILLKHGADPSAIDEDGNTPLAWAVAQGHDKAAEVLSGVRG